ncbi:GNAT family N-acetyltransferase [Bacillus sp. GM2]|uniref:GNAT family N-acetyltransferase n=1 Tax=Bacillus TaxID=1386 RepID=UPI00039AE805|nr:GNAT family protein [Bacillus paralicheniformis]MSO00084.1 GNAT family N-acetyltransferase [Bacillus paralicheniformis]MSO04091.1 GNAT family N-acetyltransferase [Bacillus paralicheniformis]MSO08084.1 GNAT family N-acetyltransferase [Bacillus paralicheniformis]MSO12078.1 GNAT family N-acetyltransferase [Bacillus paralicheniformis]NJE38480.1 N-acetyltransferase [Bacillus paralicheniformis]
MLFESSKVRLRKVTVEDAELYHIWRNDIEVMRNTNPFLDIYSIEATRDFIEQVILGSNTAKSYMILERVNEKPIGITSLINIDHKNRNAECIIDIGEKDFWGKGYGREALTLLLNYAFLEMNLHRVYLRVFSFNKKAIRLYEKLGFSHEGISREALFREGVWHDIVHMGQLQSEYLNNMDSQTSKNEKAPLV